ncbi:hypothetical protein OAX78_02740, partial [Planctomycetota bacterium]|nr:hypothetical protein [Planctomycetota bacterium]
MSNSLHASCPGPDLLLLVDQDLMAADPDDSAEIQDAERIEAHVKGCDACQAQLATLNAGLAPPPVPAPPKDVFAALTARIADQEAQEASEPAGERAQLPVRILCTYCKAGLGDVPVYCAQCLAPHHRDCFAEHGRCSVTGCESRDVVRIGPAPQRAAPAPRRRGMGGVLFLMGAALAGGGVAAFVPGPTELVAAAPTTGGDPTGALDPRTLPEAEPTPTDTALELVLVDYEVSDLLGTAPSGPPDWPEEFRQILASRKVTLNFPGTPLTDVISFLQDITGLNIVVSPQVPTEGEDRSVNLRLRDIVLNDALRMILEQTNLAMVFEHESIVIVPRRRTVVMDTHPGQPAPDPSLRGRRLSPSSLEERVAEATADHALADAPARLELIGNRLWVNQPQAVHARVRELLTALRSPETDAPAERPWFAASLHAQPSSAAARAWDYAQRTQSQQITLNFDQTPLPDALDFMRDITGIPVRLDPTVAEVVDPQGLEVSLRLRNVKLSSALDLMLASFDGLVWDTDRSGLLIRPGTTQPLEDRLAQLAANSLNVGSDLTEIRRRLRSQQIRLNFASTNLNDAINFFRDISGLNYVVSAVAGDVFNGEAVATVRGSGSLGAALDRVLAPHDLGIELANGVVRIVPRDMATERPDLSTWLSRIEELRLGEAGLVGASLADVATRYEETTKPLLGQTFGEEQGNSLPLLGNYVVLSAAARNSRVRVALPGNVTLGDALTLLEDQGVTHAWTWLQPEMVPVLVLDASERGPLSEARAAAQSESPAGDVPATLVAAHQARVKVLAGALAALHEAPAEHGEFRARLQAVDRASAQLDDLEAAWIDMRPTTAEEIALGAEGRDMLASLLDHWQAKGSALRAETIRFAAEQQDRNAILPQSTGDERERLLQELARANRDHALSVARMESESAQLRARLLHLGMLGPGLSREHEANREALEGGAAFEEVFPSGYRAWHMEARRRFQWAFKEGLQVLSAVGTSVRADCELWLADAGDAIEGRGQDGDVVSDVNGSPVGDVFELIERMGLREGDTVTITVTRGGRQVTFTVEVGPAKPLPPAESEEPADSHDGPGAFLDDPNA